MTTVLKRSAIILASLLIVLLCTPRAYAMDIRVLLESTRADAFTIYTDTGAYELQDDKGRYVTSIRRGAKVDIGKYHGSLSVYVDGNPVVDSQPSIYLAAANDDCLFEYKGKLYRGSLSIVSNDTSSYIINNLDMEYYLYGVVGREIGYNQPLEAAKAQAVASRSYAMAKLNTANKYYDIGSDTSAQSYGGYTAEKEASSGNVIRAVNDTAGEIVCYRGNPFESYYHSNAGGHTEDIANVWGGSVPLKGVPSPYDEYIEKSGYSGSIYRWQVTYSAAELRDLAERYAGRSIGEYRGIELSTTGANGRPSASGRVTEVIIKGSNGEVSAKREDIRSLLGNLKSTLFTLDGADSTTTISSNSTFYVLDKGDISPRPVDDIGAYYVQDGSGGILKTLAELGLNFIIKGAQQSVNVGSGGTATSSAGNVTIYGRGYGHGVGMSQWGAIGMAADGYRYDEILSHYFNMEDNRNFTLERFR